MSKPWKVFISHSSHDTWIARHLAADLSALGCETFLDEKDLQTGSSIDLEIGEHLATADDFLLLLTPASIASQWILIELGGALALKKNVIPIMFYTGINELPKPITLKLARIINDIDQYYAEVRIKLGTRPQPSLVPEASRQLRQQRAYKKGDRVRIVARRPKEHASTGWVEDMDEFLGQRTQVSEVVSLNPSFHVYRLAVDHQDWLWLSAWLIPDQATHRR